MKKSVLLCFSVMLFVFLTSLGCVESENMDTFQLSSDFIGTNTHTVSFINDSNLRIFCTYDKEKIYYGLYDKYTVKGNVSNIGTTNIQYCTINASFFDRKKNIPSYSDDYVEPYNIMDIAPNQTVNFSVEKKYGVATNIRYYKINVIYLS